MNNFQIVFKISVIIVDGASLSSNKQHSQKRRRLTHSSGSSKPNQLSFYSPTSKKILISAKLKHCLFIATQIGFQDTKVQYNTAIREYREVVEEHNLSDNYGQVFLVNYNAKSLIISDSQLQHLLTKGEHNV